MVRTMTMSAMKMRHMKPMMRRSVASFRTKATRILSARVRLFRTCE